MSLFKDMAKDLAGVFVKVQEYETKQVLPEYNDYSNFEEYDSSVSIEDKSYEADINTEIASVKTEKFKNFENQLSILEPVLTDTASRYKAAMATSQITVDEISENLVLIRSKLDSLVLKYNAIFKGKLSKVLEELDLKISDIEKEVVTNETEIDRLTEENKTKSGEITNLKRQREDESSNTSKSILTFDEFRSNLSSQLTKFEKEVNSNCGVK